MSRLLGPLGLVALLGLLGARAVEHARTPPFAMAIVPRERSRVSVQGVAFQVQARTGVVTVRARSGRPGHMELGPFALAPATSLVLEGVEVAVVGSGGTINVSGRDAELRRRALHVRGATLRRGSVEERHHAVEVDLETGLAKPD